MNDVIPPYALAMTTERSFWLKTAAFILLIAVCATGGYARSGGRLLEPVTDRDFYDDGNPREEEVILGNLLFFDKELSGNRNISCATCHHSLTGTGDGLSLPVGEGGRGLGMTRDNGSGPDAVHERIPRNAPPVFNLGAREFFRMFHDGRVQPDPSQPSGFQSPAGDDLPSGLDNVLAVQAMFPVTSGAEMAGQPGENLIADASAAGDLAGPNGVWGLLAQRLRAIPAYIDLFKAAYPNEIHDGSEITYVHAANAIAAFEADAWRTDNSPFDRFLRGDRDCMSVEQRKGMRLFYGKAKCSTCHSGAFQTDSEFHAIAMPQIGPGKGVGTDGHDDFGREMVTGEVSDRYSFRTPSLRNIALTPPYGHGGAYGTLEGVVRHHLNPIESLHAYDISQAMMPSRADLDAIDFVVQNDPTRRKAIADASELEPVRLREREISDLISFLLALTDPASMDLRHDVPPAVPSGLPLYE